MTIIRRGVDIRRTISNCPAAESRGPTNGEAARHIDRAVIQSRCASGIVEDEPAVFRRVPQPSVAVAIGTEVDLMRSAVRLSIGHGKVAARRCAVSVKGKPAAHHSTAPHRQAAAYGRAAADDSAAAGILDVASVRHLRIRHDLAYGIVDAAGRAALADVHPGNADIEVRIAIVIRKAHAHLAFSQG